MSPRRCYICNQKAPNITLHKFPKDAKMCGLWKDICNLEDYDTVTSLYICSEHFTKDDYREPNAKKIGGALQIKPGCYPSVNVPKQIINEEEEPIEEPMTQEEDLIEEPTTLEEDLIEEPTTLEDDPIEERMTPEENSIEEPTTPGEDPRIETMIPKRNKRKFIEPRFLGDVTSSDLANPRKAQRIVFTANRKLAEQRKKYLCLKQKTYRMEKKITSLQSLVKHLKRKKRAL
ncbi:unnamed protein product [Phyllotreta striolata]|uniref:THAP-type domain-containing protein n=1 Tax=Phyllotreta striolata TaxID=444603 RepID=A0A9P0DZI9_PHYSR|nr:unnamed protein product [Phyllotreta striolata]